MGLMFCGRGICWQVVVWATVGLFLGSTVLIAGKPAPTRIKVNNDLGYYAKTCGSWLASDGVRRVAATLGNE
jgi:hypothetical protein